MKRHIYIIMYACAMLLTACSTDDNTGGTTPVTETTDAAISFSTDVAASSSRITTGTIDNIKALQELPEGFGVWAYLTENDDYATAAAAPGFSTSFANFLMQNKQVKWGVRWVENDDDSDPSNDITHKDWVYSPLVYWPNYTGNDPANARKVSFFAYAPYTATTGAAAGITNYVRDADRAPHLIYQVGAADEQVDLLYASFKNATRNGQGLIVEETSGEETTLTYQKVPLQFHHALAAVDIYVQRVYDEPEYTGKKPGDEQNTKLYIGQLALTSKEKSGGYNTLHTSGRFDLDTETWASDGTWSTDDEVSITYPERMFVDNLRGTVSTTEAFIRDAELDKWETSTSGVTEKELLLLKNGSAQMFLPGRVTLIPTLTYSMVRRDDDLQVNYLTDSEGHRYSRMVHEISGNSVTLDFVAGKRYTLLIRIGVEHISFEVVSIVDWDFPIRYNPTVVSDYEDDIINHKLDEE